jgi:hypothetical protein
MIKSLFFGRGEISRRMRFDGWNAQLEFKPQDIWVGAFWKTTGHCVDLWVCILPCVPLHVSWWYHDPEQ